MGSNIGALILSWHLRVETGDGARRKGNCGGEYTTGGLGGDTGGEWEIKNLQKVPLGSQTTKGQRRKRLQLGNG